MNHDALLNRVHTALVRWQMFRPDGCILAAVSGGPDSLCLLHILWRLRAMGGPTLHVAHLDHGFRGAQSADEARFVADIAHNWNIPATVEYRDVPAFARSTGQGNQAAARAARYNFLAEVALRVNADAVAVAHQADDQAETVLLHLLHGAGPAGLRGMRPLVPWEAWATAPDDSSPRPPLIRPLLDTPRHEIEAYCTDHQLAPRIDPTNTSPAYTRSHIRTELLPALAAYNPQIVAALTRTAQVCADDYTFLQDHLDTLWPELAAARPGAIFLRAEQWEQLPTALQRYALRRAARQLIGSDDLGYEQIEAGRAAATRGTGTQQTLARGLLLRVEHDGLLLLYEPDYDPASAAVSSVTEVPQLGSSEIPLAVPGTTPVSEFWEAQAGSGQPPAGHDTIGKCWQVRLAAERLDGPLLLRRRRPGDRFRPAGGRGSRRLQDVFTDYKIRRELRAAWPVLATPTAIVWVAGLRADDRFQADETTQRVIWVMLRRRAACRQTSSEY